VVSASNSFRSSAHPSARLPIGRFSQPDDLADATCCLCRDEAGMASCACMEVDGGRSF
jgi:3-oxoacyl-[acyl-carrier protein] reductase